MCRVDDAEGVWLGTTIQKTRKHRRCDECHRDIAIGERYERAKWLFDGQFDTNTACEHCVAARTWLDVHCGGWVTGTLLEELEEHVAEGYKEDRLHRLLVGVKRRWQRFSGAGLMMIPNVVTQCTG